jgi:hypothetical protein
MKMHGLANPKSVKDVAMQFRWLIAGNGPIVLFV